MQQDDNTQVPTAVDPMASTPSTTTYATTVPTDTAVVPTDTATVTPAPTVEAGTVTETQLPEMDVNTLVTETPLPEMAAETVTGTADVPAEAPAMPSVDIPSEETPAPTLQ